MRVKREISPIFDPFPGNLKDRLVVVSFPDLKADGLSGTYTANTHPLSLVTFDVESSFIGLMKQNTEIRYIK